MIGDGVLDDFEQGFGGLDCPHSQLGQDHGHQGGESLVGSWDSGFGVDVNEDVLVGVDDHLQQACFVQRRVQQVQQALVHDIWAIFSIILI